MGHREGIQDVSTPATKLPSETDAYAALVQHLELGKAGWWESAIDRAILAALFVETRSLQTADLVLAVARQLSADTDGQLIEIRLAVLEQEGKISRLGTENGCRLSEATRVEIQRDQEQSEQLLSRVAERFRLLVDECGLTPSTSATWEDFSSQMIAPLIRELGARTHELLDSATRVLRSTKTFHEFLDSYPYEDRPVLQEVAIRFLDPSNSDIRAFLLGRLNQHFLLSAGHLDARTLDRLARISGTTPRFSVVLDTNFLFSILQLHTNPSNEAAVSLLRLIAESRDRVSVDLMVLPSTVNEARDALKNARNNAPRGRVTPNLARAGNVAGVSGLISKYLDVISNKGGLSPSAYFDPYIDGLETVLADRGILVASEDMTRISDRQSFKHEVSDWYSFEYVKPTGKSKAAIEHDLLLWHYVNDYRTRKDADPLEARYWVLSVDFGLIKRDEAKARNLGGLPRVIHPSEFIQLLRFWVPRSPELEEALVGAIRLPFLFYAFDAKSERTTREILDRLSRYANVDDFSTELSLRLLRDSAIRTVVESRSTNGGDGGTDAEIDDALDSVLASEVTRLTSDLEQEQRARIDAERERERLLSRVEQQRSIESGKQESKRRLQQNVQTAERRLATEETRHKRERQEREQQIAETRMERDALAKRAEAGERRIRVRDFLFIWGLATIGFIVLAERSQARLAQTSWALRVLFYLLMLVTWIVVGQVIARLRGVPDHVLVQRFLRPVSATLWGWIGAALVALLLTLAFTSPATGPTRPSVSVPPSPGVPTSR
jgi:hypothetical protein